MWLPSAFFSIFSCCSESGNQPQEDLAKSTCKTNAEIENLAILLHVGKSFNLLVKYVDFQRRNLEIYAIPTNILAIS